MPVARRPERKGNPCPMPPPLPTSARNTEETSFSVAPLRTASEAHEQARSFSSAAARMALSSSGVFTIRIRRKRSAPTTSVAWVGLRLGRLGLGPRGDDEGAPPAEGVVLLDPGLLHGDVGDLLAGDDEGRGPVRVLGEDGEH